MGKTRPTQQSNRCSSCVVSAHSMLSRNTCSFHLASSNPVCRQVRCVCMYVYAARPASLHRTAPAKTRWKRVATPRSPAKVERLIVNSIKSATPLIAAETSLFFPVAAGRETKAESGGGHHCKLKQVTHRQRDDSYTPNESVVPLAIQSSRSFRTTPCMSSVSLRTDLAHLRSQS